MDDILISHASIGTMTALVLPPIPPLSDPMWGSDQMMKLTCSAGVQERNGRQVLVGTPGSPGRARGTARVIAGSDDFHRFQTGDVLVAHTTTPVWTPLFNIAGAAVTEVGGPFSRAAIVARVRYSTRDRRNRRDAGDC